MSIVLHKISKSFGGRDVISEISFHVDSGKSFAILGGSGVGKSVTINIIAGVHLPDSGFVSIDGKNLSSCGDEDFQNIRLQTAFLTQNVGLIDSMPLWENVAFYNLYHLGIAKKQSMELAILAMGDVGIGPQYAHHLPSQISGGMRKRIGIARAMTKNPKIMLFDEPTAGLDPIRANSISVLMRQKIESAQATAVTITHDISVVRNMADFVGIMHGGSLIWTGTKDDFFASTNPAILQFINGTSDGPLNFD